MIITDLLKTSGNYFLIFWNMKIYLRWDQYNFFSLKGDRTKQPNWLVPFCLKRVWPFVYIIFCWRLGMKVGKSDSILDAHFHDLRYLTWVSLKWHVKKSRRRMGWAERVGRRITSEVRWDQSHHIPLLSHQAPKNYFAGKSRTASEVPRPQPSRLRHGALEQWWPAEVEKQLLNQ